MSLSGAPPPRKSPEPPRPIGDHPSGSWKTPNVREVFAITDIAVESAVGEVRKESTATRKTIFAADVKWFVGSMAAVAMATIGIKAWAQHEIDAGTATAVKSVGDRVTRTENDIVQIKTKVDTIERSSIRSETMAEMLVRQRGMTPPPRLLPDGGPE